MHGRDNANRRSLSVWNLAWNMDWAEGDLVWFDPGVGHPIPGEIQEVHRAAQVIVVQAMIKGKVGVDHSRRSVWIVDEFRFALCHIL